MPLDRILNSDTTRQKGAARRALMRMEHGGASNGGKSANAENGQNGQLGKIGIQTQVRGARSW